MCDMTDRLASLVRELEAHQVSNLDGDLWLTDDRFLGATDGKTVDLVDAIDAEARAVLDNGDGTVNYDALVALTDTIEIAEGRAPNNPFIAAVIITCAHGRLSIPVFSPELGVGKPTH